VFRSPFVGESIKQVGDWFVKNIVLSDGYTHASEFLVMDSRTAEDNTCILVCAKDDEIESFRCDFTDPESCKIAKKAGTPKSPTMHQAGESKTSL
jgi:hypothetical protein